MVRSAAERAGDVALVVAAPAARSNAGTDVCTGRRQLGGDVRLGGCLQTAALPVWNPLGVREERVPASRALPGLATVHGASIAVRRSPGEVFRAGVIRRHMRSHIILRCLHMPRTALARRCRRQCSGHPGLHAYMYRGCSAEGDFNQSMLCARAESFASSSFPFPPFLEFYNVGCPFFGIHAVKI
jgi:hypothetical protein